MSAALRLYDDAETRLMQVAIYAVCNPALASNDDKCDSPSARERLMRIAMDIVRGTPHWDGAKDALFKAVRNDAELLWHMFAPYRGNAAELLLREAAAMVRAEDVKKMPPAAPVAPPVMTQSAARAAMAAVASVARTSLLDTFKLNGKPLGDCTPEEANRWADKRASQAKFVHLLTQNLPPGEPIRKWRRPEDVDAAFEQAKQSND